MEALAGEIAAIGTAFCFAASSMLFTIAGRSAGASIVNRARLLIAAILAAGIYWVTRGVPVPLGLAGGAWLWLSLSGVLGLALGDDLLFRAYVRVGAALSMLIFALSPAIAATLSWIFLDQGLRSAEIVGIAFTLAGIAWVVTEPKRVANGGRDRANLSGVLFAFGGAVGQALGLVTAKLGLLQGANAQQANFIRLLAAAVVVWILTALSGRVPASLKMLKNERRASVFTVLGATFGPVLGVWLSLVAIERAPVGVASTLMSLTPLILLPVGRLVFHEPVTLRALLGTCLALSGVWLLLW